MEETLNAAGNLEQQALNDAGSQEQETGGQRRKKIWQIKSGYYCSVIGTCLSRVDLKQIARKKIFSLSSGLDAFSVHRVLSTIASDRLPKTRALNKILDTKHRAAIKRYMLLDGDDDLVRAEWEKDLRSGGGISGAYWAIMSMASCGRDLLDQVYGDCHMVSYDIFSSYSSSAKITASLRRQIETLQRSLEKTKTTYQKERECVRWELGELQKSKGEFLRQRLVSERLVKENKELKADLERERDKQRSSVLFDELELLKKENDSMKEELQFSTKTSKIHVDQFENSEGKARELEEEVIAVRVMAAELQEEIVSLEQMFQLGMGSKSVCDSCEEKVEKSCTGVGLSGKAVLYVGGRYNMIAHYRDMVEKNGGIFLHHDGGKESSRSLLPKMLSGADAVLCPVDCISHDACKCVKKICKRNSKPFVMMRSSGLSSLARGLETIIQ
ncbi:MAG: hypothetical protein COA36_09890 [Desulfotalea sp.]|nr:MAG: hypothetical protein COA36_09890 [Desulfotalea sp.]